MKKIRIKAVSPKLNKTVKTKTKIKFKNKVPKNQKVKKAKKIQKNNKKCNRCLMAIIGIYYFFKILSNPKRIKIDKQVREKIVKDIKRKFKQNNYKTCIEPFEEVYNKLTNV